MLRLTACGLYLAELMLREAIVTWAILSKSLGGRDVAPNLSDYTEVCSRFSWTQADNARLWRQEKGGMCRMNLSSLRGRQAMT
jgi:hypothetical protein